MKANNHALKYTSFYKEEAKNKYSIDFFLEKLNKIYPIEVKSSGYTAHASIDEFCKKYHQYVGGGIIIYSKNLKVEGKYTYLPVYMTMCL